MDAVLRPRRTVLVAVDHDSATQRVVEFVNTFFLDLEVTVIGINVGIPGPPPPPLPLAPAIGTPLWPVGGSADVTDPTDDPFEHAADAVAASGLLVDETIADVGDPVTRVCKAAAEREVDLLVIGDNHRGIWHRLMEGDVAGEIRRSAPCPVLVVP